jgi:hypothetical protein
MRPAERSRKTAAKAHPSALVGAIHPLNKALWSHVCPILIYELDAPGATVRVMNYPPTVGNLDKGRPK